MMHTLICEILLQEAPQVVQKSHRDVIILDCVVFACLGDDRGDVQAC